MPVLRTVRPPEDTVLSLVVREPYVTIPQGLDAYARFHERFGTGFAPPELTPERTPERTREAFDPIEMRSRRPPWRGAIHDFLAGLVPYAELERRAAAADPAVTAAVAEDRAARPSAHKERRKGARRAAYHAARTRACATGRTTSMRPSPASCCWQILTVDVTRIGVTVVREA